MRRAVSRVILDLAHGEISDENHATFQVIVRDDSGYALFTATLEFSTDWQYVWRS